MGISGINIYDNLGNNVLHYASRRDNERIVSFLIESGCDVNHENKDGATPLHIAAQYSSKQVIIVRVVE